MSFVKDCVFSVLRDKAVSSITRIVDGTQACAALNETLIDSAADATGPNRCDLCSGAEVKVDFKPLTDNSTLAQKLARCFINKLAGPAARKLGPTLSESEKKLLERALEEGSGALKDAMVSSVTQKIVGKCNKGSVDYAIYIGMDIQVGGSHYSVGGEVLDRGTCTKAFGALNRQCDECQ